MEFTGAFTAAEQKSGILTLKAGEKVSVVLTRASTLTGSIRLEEVNAANAVVSTPLTFSADADVNTTYRNQGSADQRLRLRCVAIGGGESVTYTLADVENEAQSGGLKNERSQAVLDVVEDGVQIPAGKTILYEGVEYSGASSHQPMAPDLNLAAGAGRDAADGSSFLASVMGNVLGSTLTKTANYIAGVIGALSVLGTKASNYPVGGVLGIIMDGVTQADGAVVAVLDGDSAVTKANAAFKARARNSTPGSGFDYGLDVHDPAEGGYSALAILKADVRMSNEVCFLSGAGVPVDYTDGDPVATGEGYAQIGSIYIDRTNGKLYINGGTKAQPIWKLVTSAA